MNNPKHIKSPFTEDLKKELVDKYWLIYTQNCQEGLMRKVLIKDGNLQFEWKLPDKSLTSNRIGNYAPDPTFTGPFESPFEALSYRRHELEKAS